MSVCECLIASGDALAAAVLAYEDERRKIGLSLRTARLRQRMVDAAHAMNTANDSARAILSAAAHGLLGQADPAPPIPANDFEPEPHRA